MYLNVKMIKRDGFNASTQTVEIEVVVYNNTHVTELRRQGYEIDYIELVDRKY